MLTPEPAPTRARSLAVWGDPIEHSLSPRLHAAAYRVLGLEWEYGRRRVDEQSFDEALRGLGPHWRGLSLTMPLKHRAAAAAATLDEPARLTGAVNTLLLTAGAPAGFNTDVGGLARALREQGVADATTARILGAGATATSALVALAELGARRVEIVARRPEAAAGLRDLGDALNVRVEVRSLAEPRPELVDVTVATLPGGVDLGRDAERLAESGGALLDVVYGSWPTPLAQAWRAAGRSARSGLGMLLNQALLQVRVFVGGHTGAELPDEPAVLAAMRAAIMGD